MDRRLTERCPKCWSASPLTWEAGPGGWPPDPFTEPLEVGGARLSALFRCPVHGEFGFGEENEPVFLEPELWAVGEGGRRVPFGGS